AEVAAIERTVAVRIGDARIAGVVLDVEDAVGVAVPGVRDRRAGTAGADGDRQLAAVQPDLVAQVLVVVVDARIEDRDQGVGAPGRHLPGEIRGDAARAR